ncbi:MAG TPA: sulfatase-like hydrolase/transferase, partial [Thermoanaerobaculia bacterium]|nr:sulfatase-like hydrolase/transferase [Thermoanaerobaculia bacterium]
MKKIVLIPIALAAAGVLLFARRPRPRVRLSLPIGGGEYSSVGGGHREGTWLWPGESVRWTIPPGPAVRARLLYHLPVDWAAAGPEALVVRVGSGAAPPETAEKSALARGAVEPRWSESSVAVPASASPRSLEVSVEGADAARPLFLASSTLEWPRPAKMPARRLVVLFDVDTLRADHLPLYGYARPTTPEIDRVFASGLVAERCYANASWTLPSHVSIFTSTTVNRHGVRSTDGLVPPNFPVLAESLAAGGFSTLAVT